MIRHTALSLAAFDGNLTAQPLSLSKVTLTVPGAGVAHDQRVPPAARPLDPARTGRQSIKIRLG